MTVWQIILLAWMAYQLFAVFRTYFLGVKNNDRKSVNIVALLIGAGIWFLIFEAMLQCGLLDGIIIGRIRIG